MGNTVSTQSATTVRSIVSSGSDLEAARKLFQSSSSLILSPLSNNRLRDALVASSSCSVSSSSSSSMLMSPLLLQARHSYANFLLRDESIKLALPSSLFESSSASSSGTTVSRYFLHQAQQEHHHQQTGVFASAGKFIKNFIFSILQKIQEKANQFSSVLVGVANFAIKNPRFILAGSVGIASLAGVAYFLVVKQDILRQYHRDHDNDDDDETKMFSELEKQLIRQKIQAQSDLDHEQKKNFCPMENEKRNSHLSLFCPITCELFEDPVFVTTSGHTFERRAITEWILNFSSSPSSSTANGGDHTEQQQQQQQARCPITRVPISLDNLVPNLALKEAVREYVMEQQKKKQHEEEGEENCVTRPRKANPSQNDDDDLD